MGLRKSLLLYRLTQWFEDVRLSDYFRPESEQAKSSLVNQSRTHYQ